MNEIILNKVFQLITSAEDQGELIRLIWIHPNGQFAQYVSLSINVAMPHPIKVTKLQATIDNGFTAEADDPFARVFNEDEIPESYKIIRERKMQVVKYIWEKNTDRALLKNERPGLFAEAAGLFDFHPMEVRRIMSRYWQRGMVPNAMLPDYDKRGLRGIQAGGTERKRGRPREKFGPQAEMPGINITAEIQDKIKESIDTFYLSRSKPTIKDAYQQMLLRHFSDLSYKNGEKQRIIWSPDRIPSYSQYYYWFKKFFDNRKTWMSRDGEREFALKFRELLGDNTAEAFGPGSKYQIDATIADVYLVSTANSNYIIGRPVVYLVMDVFSRLIVGMYVGIEGPSWIGAMMAVDNVVMDKVEYCKQYGIDISLEKWPSSLLPERLLADRGEFEGKCPEGMMRNLGISIENTPPYRGDLKGIVERHFRTTNERIKVRLPGAIRKAVKARGEADYRQDAQLNIDEFRRMMIHEVIRHNTSVMEHHSKSMLEINDNVPPVPTDIWQWGIKNRRCGFVARDRDFVRLSLMPRESATITREGIRFHGIYYSCDLAIKEGWFIAPRKTSIQIAYDPRRLDNIYIPDDIGRGFTKCFPVANSKQYGDMCFDDYIMLRKYLEEEKAYLKAAKTQNEINTDEEIRKIKNQAKQRAKLTQSEDISKSQKLRDIRENRATERLGRREIGGFELGSIKPNSGSSQVVKMADVINLEDGQKRKSQSDYEDEILSVLKRERDDRLDRKR